MNRISHFTSSLAHEYVTKRLHFGKLEEFDANIRYTGPCGESMEFFVKCEEGKISDISFLFDGCSVLAACGSAACVLTKGSSLEDAFMIRPIDLRRHLGIPDEMDVDCPKLSILSLRKTIDSLRLNE